jgi:hypothetical protein
MHPTVAAVGSLTWPSKHDAKSEPLMKCRGANIHAASSHVYPFNLPTRFREDRKKKAARRRSTDIASRVHTRSGVVTLKNFCPLTLDEEDEMQVTKSGDFIAGMGNVEREILANPRGRGVPVTAANLKRNQASAIVPVPEGATIEGQRAWNIGKGGLQPRASRGLPRPC